MALGIAPMWLSVITGTLTIALLALGYKFISRTEKGTIEKTYKYAIIGVMPIAIVHLLGGMLELGALPEGLALPLEYMDSFSFIFLIIMLAMGIEILREQTHLGANGKNRGN